MLFRDVIDLISVTYEQSPSGAPIEVETPRQVFANKRSVRQSEFYAAAMVGLRPEIMFEVRTVEYQGEELLDYEGRRYEVIRSYDRNGEVTELVCKAAVNE